MLSTVTEVSCGQRRESGFITEPVVVQRAENQSKNRDEFINFIVRVSTSFVIFFGDNCNRSHEVYFKCQSGSDEVLELSP